MNSNRLYSLLLSATVLLAMTVPAMSQANNKTYILVHGAWYGGGWIWNKVTPRLESKGYKVLPVDLPGYGGDTTLASKLTLIDYVNKVVAAAQSVKGKVALVGHSMGGAVISQAAEVLGPEKVDKLVYLDAFLLKDGESIFSQVEKISKASSGGPSAPDYLILSDDKKTCLFNPLKLQEYFCHDCSAEDLKQAQANLRWQPVSVLATPIHVTDSRCGRIPKIYIRCTAAKDLDRRTVVQNMPCEKVYELPSSHSPFFSMPEKLAATLVEAY